MKFEKRGDKYRARMQHKGKTYYAWFDNMPTEREAMLALSEKVASSGEVVDKTIFAYAIKNYIEDRSNTASPSTLRGYRTIERSLPERLTSCKMSDIDQQLIQSVINEMAATRAPKTIRNIHGLISAVIKVYRPNMTLNTSLPAKIKNDPYIPTEQDIKALMAAAKDTRYEIPLMLGCFALRRSEICALDINDDVDYDNCVIHINKAKVRGEGGWTIKTVTKTTEGKRDVVVPQPLIDKIKEAGVIYDGDPNRITHWIVETEKS